MASGNLYKLVNIEGKGLGCVAIDEIKPGTLILKEKPQCTMLCVKSNRYEDIITAFYVMKKSDQDEYMKLYNKYKAQCSKIRKKSEKFCEITFHKKIIGPMANNQEGKIIRHCLEGQ